MEDYTGSAETRQEVEASKEPQSAVYWLAEIKAATKRDEKWHDRARKIIKKYRAERDRRADSDATMNILWSNTEVLLAALFSSLGKPDVRRRFPKSGRDMKISRNVALILENALSVSSDHNDEDYEVERAVKDMLLPGRGNVWMELDADEDDDGYVSSVKCRTVHVEWDSYRQGPGNRWGDIPWVARRLLYTRDDLKAQFPEPHALKAPLTYDMEGHSAKDLRDKPEMFKRAALWEVWDKNRKERIYVAEDYEWILKSTPDPYRLENFFPCPRPLVAIDTTNSAVPIPEYTLYQDQAEELNQITTRIFRLVKMLKVSGVYDATQDDHEQLANLQHADDGEFLPYKGIAALNARGQGLKDAFLFWPMAEIIAALQQLYIQRDQLVQSIYQITGISDIIRGQSDPRETKGAQQLKAQFGSVRMQRRQREVQRFVRDIFRIKAELIAEHYPREQLEAMTGIPLPTQAEQRQARMTLVAIEMRQHEMAALQGPPQGAPAMGQPGPSGSLPAPQGGAPQQMAGLPS